MKVYDRQVLMSLVRFGIGHYAEALPQGVNWNSIQTLAIQQGLYAIVLDGIGKLPENIRPKQELLLEWIGEVLQSYEYCYDAYKKTIAEMGGFYISHGYKMMVLKGYACSLDWPKPEHRPCGDIDIWQFGDYKNADKCVAKEKKVEIDNSHHHHTVFEWGEFTVENHYDFVNVHANRTNAQLEVIFKELGKDDSHWVELRDASTGSPSKVYLPSPNLHALFLLRHAIIEFAATGLNLRQLLDWAFFWEKHGKEVDEKWLAGLLEKYHMSAFFNIINAICVEELGFKPNIFPSVQYVPEMKDRVLKEILQPEFDWLKAHDKNVIKRILFKYRRWKGNAWKRKLCSNDSSWSTFWNNVWGHVLKPASI